MLFSEVVGQKEVKQGLLKSVQGGRIPHAQLFYGADGAGTLPMALAYAQYINCSARTADDACGTCPSCRKIQKLSHPDLHFVFPVNTSKKVSKDPVSDDYIAEWREFIQQNAYFRSEMWYEFMGLENKQGLISKRDSDAAIRKLNLKSFEAEYKIMIIWLPETMNAPSSNVLLKLIEEPPQKTIFLLVSENPEQILLTITSRTQPVKLKPIDAESLSDELTQKYSLNAEELRFTVRLSQGSYIKALEIINSSEANNANLESFINIMRLCYGRKFVEINQWVEEMAALGRERLKTFFDYALRMIRENFIQNLNNPDLLYLTQKEAAFSERFHPYVNGKNIMAMYRELSEASADIERNGYAKIVLTDLTIKLMRLINPKA